jgi:acetolactate decarboxylase
MRAFGVFLFLLSGCPAEPLSAPEVDAGPLPPASLIGSPEVKIFGTLRSVFQDGDFSANASLLDEGTNAQAVGLGALSGLRGEITILDGESWLSYPEGEDSIRVVNENAPDDEAALLAVSEVSEWVRFTLEEELSYGDLTQKIVSTLAASHWPDTGALPFKIEGNIKRVDWHVIDGSRLPPGQASHEDHENAAVSGSLEGGSPVLVGFYSTQHAGVITHGGVRLHVHMIDSQRRITGHVEDALIGAGSILSLPAPLLSQ